MQSIQRLPVARLRTFGKNKNETDQLRRVRGILLERGAEFGHLLFDITAHAGLAD